MNASIITIGDELLIGQVIDTNSARIANAMYPLGIEISRKFTVADQQEEIIYALKEASTISDIIFITGGLGPTKDDITKKAMADFFSVPLIFSDENKDHLTQILAPRGIPLTESLFSQCYIPANAKLLDNQMGTALGMWMENNNTIYISMPGVPYEMDYIINQAVIPKLKELPLTQHLYYTTIHTVGVGETYLADKIEPLLHQLPKHIHVAYLPAIGQVRLRLHGKHSDYDLLHRQVDEFTAMIVKEIEPYFLSLGETSLEKEVGKLLKQKGLNLSTAESCTGGHLAHKITSVPGSSAYYLGSIIAYDNSIKIKQLSVKASDIEKFGVVSEAVVIEMAESCRKLLQTDISISLSGIAGPDGGTPEKPVGTVWMALASKNKTITKTYRFSKDRARNIESSAIYALILLWNYLKSLKDS